MFSLVFMLNTKPEERANLNAMIEVTLSKVSVPGWLCLNPVTTFSPDFSTSKILDALCLQELELKILSNVSCLLQHRINF